jgi:hypothetical protein
MLEEGGGKALRGVKHAGVLPLVFPQSYPTQCRLFACSREELFQLEDAIAFFESHKRQN